MQQRLHDNEISGNEGGTDTTTDFGKLITAVSGGQPIDLIIDGIFKPSTLDENGRPQGICFQNNGENLVFLNLNGAKGMTPEAIGENMDNDISLFDCSLPDFDTSEHNKWLAANKK